METPPPRATTPNHAARGVLLPTTREGPTAEFRRAPAWMGTKPPTEARGVSPSFFRNPKGRSFRPSEDPLLGTF